MQKLNHPHILTIDDIVNIEGKQALLMPECEKSLAAMGPLPIGKTAELLLPIVRALQYAHLQGLIHRDIKPSNILLKDSTVYLADFGLAAHEMKDINSLASTNLTSLAGTIGYVAPEILKGQEATPKSDVYSLAAVFYSLITGRTVDHELDDTLQKIGGEIGIVTGMHVKKGLRVNPSDRSSLMDFEVGLRDIIDAANGKFSPIRLSQLVQLGPTNPLPHVYKFPTTNKFEKMSIQTFNELYQKRQLGKLLIQIPFIVNNNREIDYDLKIPLETIAETCLGEEFHGITGASEAYALVLIGSALYRHTQKVTTRNRGWWLWKSQETITSSPFPNDIDIVVIGKDSYNQAPVITSGIHKALPNHEEKISDVYGGYFIREFGYNIHAIYRTEEQLMNGALAGDTVSASVLRYGVPLVGDAYFSELCTKMQKIERNALHEISWKNDGYFATATLLDLVQLRNIGSPTEVIIHDKNGWTDSYKSMYR